MRSFFPLPDTYAVAQVDVEATLSGISDLDRRARAAAKLIKPAKALVYLHTVCTTFTSSTVAIGVLTCRK